MALNNEEEYILFELEYKALTKDKTKIFGYDFVKKNKDKCKIIYKGKEYELTENIGDIDNNHNSSIKFQLRINNNITDISYMFSGCKTLLSIRLDDSNIININESPSEYNSDIHSEKSNNSNGTEKSEIFYT